MIELGQCLGDILGNTVSFSMHDVIACAFAQKYTFAFLYQVEIAK